MTISFQKAGSAPRASLFAVSMDMSRASEVSFIAAYRTSAFCAVALRESLHTVLSSISIVPSLMYVEDLKCIVYGGKASRTSTL